MDFKSVAKAIAGAVATGVGGLGTAYVAVPADVPMPWYGYVAVGLINAALGFAVVYFAPRNTVTK